MSSNLSQNSDNSPTKKRKKIMSLSKPINLDQMSNVIKKAKIDTKKINNKSGLD